MPDRKIAKRYAYALFEESVKQKIEDEIKQELENVSNILKEKKNVIFFTSPRIKLSQKKEVINKIITETTPELFKNFLIYLLTKNRFENLYYISEEFNNLYNLKNKILEVNIYSVVEINNVLKEKLRKKLEEITGKKIILHCYLDKSIIGGALIKIEDKIIDGTIKNQLAKISENLLERK